MLNCFTPDNNGAEQLAPAIAKLHQLTHLSVGGFYKEAGAKDLAPVLKTLTQLTDLTVYGKYGAEGMVAINNVKRHLGIPVY